MSSPLFTPASVDTELTSELMEGQGWICPRDDGEGAPFSAWPSTTSCARGSERLHRFTTELGDTVGVGWGGVGADLWAHDSYRPAATCGQVSVSLNQSSKMSRDILVTQRHFILCSPQRLQTRHNTQIQIYLFDSQHATLMPHCRYSALQRLRFALSI